MSVFEARKTYRTRRGGEFYVFEVGREIFGRERSSPEEPWRVSSRRLDGRLILGGETGADLIPPEPPIPPVVVSDAVLQAGFNKGRGGANWDRGERVAEYRGAITSWLREHPHALAGYRRDCAEREGGE